MEFVQPIRDKQLIEQLKTELLKSSYRDYMLFITGINTGFRISDLLPLKVSDIKDKTHICIREEKTGKQKRIKINDYLKRELDKYTGTMSDDDYLFPSRQGEKQHITRSQAYRVLDKAKKKVGITDKVGTHTLRKTFGYHYYQKYKDVALLQNIFNHSHPSITLKYIGINDDMIDKSMDDFSL